MASSKKSAKLTRYQDTTGSLGSGGLQWGMWFVSHKLFFRRVTIIILSVWNIFAIGIGLVLWMKYFGFDLVQDRQLLAQQVALSANYESIHARYAAQPLSVGRTQVFRGTEGKYDLVSPVRNPNSTWIAHVTYHYEFAGGASPATTQVILPAQEAIVPAFGVEHEVFPSQVTYVQDDIRWERVNPHNIASVGQHMAEYLQFAIEEFTFTPAGQETDSPHPQVAFEIVNNSIYSYWEVPFVLELQRGGQIVGYLPFLERNMPAQTRRSISQRIFTDLSGVSRVRIIPSVNIFDPTAIMPDIL